MYRWHTERGCFRKSHFPVHKLRPQRILPEQELHLRNFKKQEIKPRNSDYKKVYIYCPFFFFLHRGISFRRVPFRVVFFPAEPQKHILRTRALIHSIWPARSRPSFRCDLLKRQRNKLLSSNSKAAVLLSEISKTDLKLTTSKLDSI